MSYLRYSHLTQLHQDFFKAYHTVGVRSMGEALHVFLCRAIFLPFGRNKHYVFLLQNSERWMKEQDAVVYQLPNGGAKIETTELPVMVYGMLADAWDHLLQDMVDAEDRKRTVQE